MRSTVFFASGMLPLCLILAAASVRADTDELCLGLDKTELFSRCGFEEQSVVLALPFCGRVVIGEMVYFLNDYERVAIAVYSTENEAKQAFRYWRFLVAATPPPPGEPIGEEMTWGSSSGVPEHMRGGAIRFRRGNVLFSLVKADGEPSLLVLARQIDDWIQNDRQIAPRGKFDPPAEIVDTGIPKTLVVRPMKEPLPPPAPGTRRVGNWPEFRNPGGGDTELAFVNIQPQFRGLGDTNKLRLLLTEKDQEGGNMLQSMLSPIGQEHPQGEPIYVPDGPNRIRVVKRSEAAAQGIDGRFIMRIVVPDEAKTLKLTMIAATEDNLIVTKDVEVRIVPQE